MKSVFLFEVWCFSKYFFAVFLWKQLKIKFLLASVKLFTNCENSSIYSLQKASSGFQVAAYDFKSCSKSRLGYWPMTAKDSRNINSDAAFAANFRISKCIQRNKQKLFYIYYFSLWQRSLKITKPFAHVQKVLIYSNKPSTKYSGDTVPLKTNVGSTSAHV